MTNSTARKVIPRSIWALGLTSLFMDASSELIHSLLPVLMVSKLGASMILVGVVEGVAESTASITKIFSGTISDYMRKRKVLVVIGYGLALITKPLFPLANSMAVVVAARFIDRIGKGIRGAPRDALIGDIAPPEVRGASFGLRQSLDTIGAFMGPLLAIGGMLLFANDITTVLWIAVIPAAIAVAILVFGVKEPETHRTLNTEVPSLQLRDLRNVGPAYWQLVAVAGLLTLARFSEAFLILKAQSTGLPILLVPMVMVVMNIAYALAAYPAGKLSDTIDRRRVLLIGLVMLIAADLVLGFGENLWMLGLGVTLWGLHMAFTQGLLAAMVADTTPTELRGTAYGVFNFVCGIAMLIASVVAGALWDSFGASTTFFAGAGFSAVSLLGLLFVYRKTR
ncbi:MAG: MFS transporter [bacterium]|nr:MFS transporter [bacterium]